MHFEKRSQPALDLQNFGLLQIDDQPLTLLQPPCLALLVLVFGFGESQLTHAIFQLKGATAKFFGGCAEVP